MAVRDNPAVVGAAHAALAASDEARGAFGGLLPEVSLDADLRRAEDQASRGSLTESASISARITIPLYQAGSAYSVVREARQVAAQRRLEVDESRRAVYEEATQAWQDLVAARAQIAAFGDAVRAAEIALEGVEQEAAVGSRTTLDVLDAEQELFDAKVDLVRAQRDEVVASFTLRGTVGRLTAEALGLPVEIYDASHHYQKVRNKLFGFGTEIYRAQGRYAEAEPLDQRALAIGEKALGPEHPQSVPPVTAELAEEAADDTPQPAPAAPQPAEDAPPSGPPPTEVATTPAYRVHLASFRQRETAESEWRRLLKTHGDLLADLIPTIWRVDLGSDKGIYYRLHAGPLADAEAAESLCRTLAKHRVRCLVTPPA